MVLLLLAVACESDDARLACLENDHATAVLEDLRARQHPDWPVDSTLAAHRRLLLTQRALDRFLNGR